METISDPFREKRNQDGVLRCEFQGESVPMILRHADVRDTAKDWKAFSSDAPFRVPIPSEEDVRTMRQLPVETDPPDHTDHRKIVEPFFLRAGNPVVIAQVEALVPVKSKGRVSLCWASANQDEAVFEAPGEVRLDRKPNPHLAFGFGAHLCLGAAHARLLLRTLLQKCTDRLASITVLDARGRVEHESAYQRVMGYESLTIELTPR